MFGDEKKVDEDILVKKPKVKEEVKVKEPANESVSVDLKILKDLKSAWAGVHDAFAKNGQPLLKDAIEKLIKLVK